MEVSLSSHSQSNCDLIEMTFSVYADSNAAPPIIIFSIFSSRGINWWSMANWNWSGMSAQKLKFPSIFCKTFHSFNINLPGKYSWLLCSLLWMIFHLPFGLDLMIMLIPVLIIIPYVFYKTQNSLTGIFIHGIYNGPIFILVALGLI